MVWTNNFPISASPSALRTVHPCFSSKSPIRAIIGYLSSPFARIYFLLLTNYMHGLKLKSLLVFMSRSLWAAFLIVGVPMKPSNSTTDFLYELRIKSTQGTTMFSYVSLLHNQIRIYWDLPSKMYLSVISQLSDSSILDCLIYWITVSANSDLSAFPNRLCHSNYAARYAQNP